MVGGSWEGRGGERKGGELCHLLLVQHLLIQLLHQLRLLVDLLVLEDRKDGGEVRGKEKHNTSLIYFHDNHQAPLNASQSRHLLSNRNTTCEKDQTLEASRYVRV